MSDEGLRSISDPLSATTRVERRWLLISSVVLAGMTWGGLTPSRITAAGIEITRTNTGVLVSLACLITTYFCAAFWFYGRADIFAARRALSDHIDLLIRAGAEPGAGRELGMTDDDFAAALSAYFDIQMERHLYPRYRFEMWSALAAGLSSIASALLWLALR